MAAKDRLTAAGTGSIPVSRIMAGFIFLICIALIGIEAVKIINERGKVLADARKDMANLASSLAQHADLTFKAADTLLVSIVQRLDRDILANQNDRQHLRNLFLREGGLNPQFLNFAVIDRDGVAVVAAVGYGSSSNFSEDDYFVHQRDRDSRELFVGKPANSGIAEGWHMPIARRFNRADGSFGGVAVIALDLGYFQALYDGLDLGKNGAVLLASTRGPLLVRRPFVESNIGRDMSHSGLFKQLKIAPVGSVEITASTDGVRRLNSYEQVLNYPLFVAVAQDVAELLQPWKESAVRQSGIAALVVALIGVMGAIVWQMTRALTRGARQLQRTNIRFEAALSNMVQGLCLFDADKNLVISNSRFREIYDLPPELVARGTPLQKILDYQQQHGVSDHRTVAENLEQIPNLLRQSISTADGRIISIQRAPIQGGGWVATHEDVTEQTRQEQLIEEKAAELEIINERFDAAMNNMVQGLSMFDSERRLVVWNARYAEIFKYPPGYLRVGMEVNALAVDLVTRGVLKGGRAASAVAKEVAAMEERARDAHWIEELADGRFIQISRQPLGDGGWLAISEDITERRQAEDEIVRLARNDTLTGLANRAEFNVRLEQASKRVKRYGSSITVMMLDLDKFKAVNDTLGHPAGDSLLIEVAQRLAATLRDTDVLARLGGDEFAIIQEGGTAQREGAIALALRIIQSLNAPFDLDGHEARIGTSIGIALAPEHGSDPQDLLKKADLALYEVKAAGRNDFRIFQAGMLDLVNAHHTAEEELRNAIAREEFELHYQPVVDARTNTPCGAEALVRWNHPVKGVIGPDQFIPLAESTGLIVPLGDWVLQRACTDAVSWPPSMKVAVNVSSVQFSKGDLFDVILCTLVESGLAPDRLELEITETALLENREKILADVRQLKNLGISLAIDDFGTGYSSMKHLTVFPFDKVKIDKSLTQGALARRDHEALIVSTLTLAKALGIAVAAEGIETEEHLGFARKAGVDLVQGYLLGRPVPLSRLGLPAAGRPDEMVA